MLDATLHRILENFVNSQSDLQVGFKNIVRDRLLKRNYSQPYLIRKVYLPYMEG